MAETGRAGWTNAPTDLLIEVRATKNNIYTLSDVAPIGTKQCQFSAPLTILQCNLANSNR